MLTAILQRALRPRMKKAIYKCLYGGRWTPFDAATAAIYRRLPDAHPLVLQVLRETPPRVRLHPLTLRRAFLVALVLAAAAPLISKGAYEEWHPEPTHAPLPPFYYQVSAELLQAICRFSVPHGWVAHSCVERSYHEGRCIIYVDHDMPKWLKEHEEKHCAGYDHKPLTEGPAPFVFRR